MSRLSDLIPTSLTPSQGGFLHRRDHRGHHKSAWFVHAAALGRIEIRGDGPNVTLHRGEPEPAGSCAVLDALFEHGESVSVGDDRPDFLRAWELVDRRLERWSIDADVLKPAPIRRIMRWSRPHTPYGRRLAADVALLGTEVCAASPHQLADAAHDEDLAELTAWAIALDLGDEWRRRVAEAVSSSEPLLTTDDEQVQFISFALLFHVAANRSAKAPMQVDIVGRRKSEGENRPGAFLNLVRKR